MPAGRRRAAERRLPGDVRPGAAAYFGGPYLVWMGEGQPASDLCAHPLTDFFDGTATPSPLVCGACTCSAAERVVRAAGDGDRERSLRARARGPTPRSSCRAAGTGAARRSGGVRGRRGVRDGRAAGPGRREVRAADGHGHEESAPRAVALRARVPGRRQVAARKRDVCAPALPTVPSSEQAALMWTYCVSMEEPTKACPVHAYPIRRDFGDGWTDVPTCTPCTCGAAGRQPCSPSTVTAYSDAACTAMDAVGAVEAQTSTSSCAPLSTAVVAREHEREPVHVRARDVHAERRRCHRRPAHPRRGDDLLLPGVTLPQCDRSSCSSPSPSSAAARRTRARRTPASCGDGGDGNVHRPVRAGWARRRVLPLPLVRPRGLDATRVPRPCWTAAGAQGFLDAPPSKVTCSPACACSPSENLCGLPITMTASTAACPPNGAVPFDAPTRVGRHVLHDGSRRLRPGRLRSTRPCVGERGSCAASMPNVVTVEGGGATIALTCQGPAPSVTGVCLGAEQDVHVPERARVLRVT